MSYTQAAAFLASLLQGLSTTLRMAVPQPGLVIGSPGSPIVNGSSQSGSNLNISGFTAGYVIQAGQFFSIVSGGKRYLHQVTAAQTANGSGNATLPILPMLRVSPTGGDVCEFATPYIEGFLDGNSQSWTIGLVQNVGLSFSINEAA